MFNWLINLFRRPKLSVEDIMALANARQARIDSATKYASTSISNQKRLPPYPRPAPPPPPPPAPHRRRSLEERRQDCYSRDSEGNTLFNTVMWASILSDHGHTSSNCSSSSNDYSSSSSDFGSSDCGSSD